MNKVLAALCIGVAAGGATGAIVGAALLGSGPADATESPVAVARESARPPSPPTAPITSRDDGAREAAALPVAIRDVVDGGAVLAAARGDRVLDGTVRDEDGAPLEGVLVRAERRAPDTISRSSRGEVPVEPDLEEVVREAIELHQERLSRRYGTTSGPDGYWSLRELPDGPFTVRAYAEGLDLDASGPTTVRPDATVDFVARRLFAVTVDVRLPDGSPADQATVRAVRREAAAARTTTELWSRASPELRLVGGFYSVSATIEPTTGSIHERTGDLRSAESTLGLDRDGDVVTLRLEGRPGIRGRVVTTGLRPPGSWMIRVKRLDPGEALDAEALRREADQTTWINARSSTFEFLDLDPGRYAVGAGQSWNGPVETVEAVEVGAGLALIDLRPPPVTEDDCLVVTVADHEGRPVTFAKLEWRVEAGDSRQAGDLDSVARVPGEFWCPAPDGLRGALWEGAPADSIELTVTTAFGKRTMPLERGRRRVDVRVDATAVVWATVSGYAGSGLEGALSLSLRAQTSGFTARGDAVRGDAPTRMGPVEVGEYEAILTYRSRQGGRSRSFEIHRIPVTVTAPETRVAVPIPPLYTVTAISEDADRGTVTIRSQRGPVRVSAPIEGGVARLENIPAGEYYLDRSGTDVDGRMRLSVPAVTQVVFAREPLAAMRVTIRDAQGYLAQAGFADGDHIVAVAGQPFDGQGEFQQALASATGDEGAIATVIRDGARRDVSIDAVRLLAGQGLGGSWKATWAP